MPAAVRLRAAGCHAAANWSQQTGASSTDCVLRCLARCRQCASWLCCGTGLLLCMSAAPRACCAWLARHVCHSCLQPQSCRTRAGCLLIALVQLCPAYAATAPIMGLQRLQLDMNLPPFPPPAHRQLLPICCYASPAQQPALPTLSLHSWVASAAPVAAPCLLRACHCRCLQHQAVLPTKVSQHALHEPMCAACCIGPSYCSNCSFPFLSSPSASCAVKPCCRSIVSQPNKAAAAAATRQQKQDSGTWRGAANNSGSAPAASARCRARARAGCASSDAATGASSSSSQQSAGGARSSRRSRRLRHVPASGALALSGRPPPPPAHRGEASNLVAQALGLDDRHLLADALVGVEVQSQPLVVLLNDDPADGKRHVRPRGQPEAGSSGTGEHGSPPGGLLDRLGAHATCIHTGHA